MMYLLVDWKLIRTLSSLSGLTPSVLAQPIRVAYYEISDPLIFIQLNTLGIMETPSVPSAVRKQMLFLGLPLPDSEQFGVVMMCPQV